MCSSLSFYSIQNHNLCHFLFFLFLFMKYVTFLIGDMTLVLIWLALDYRKKEKKRKLREEPPIQAHISHQPKLGINGEKVKHKKVQVSWPITNDIKFQFYPQPFTKILYFIGGI